MATKGREAFYFGTAILGIWLFVLEINLYRKTIIPFTVPFAVTLLFTTVTFFLIRHDYQRTYPRAALFYSFVQSLLSFGFIGCFCFMTLNYYFAKKDVEILSFAIKGKHRIGTKNPQPAIEIDYKGVDKQLVFYTGQQEEVNASDSVLLTVQKGLFGYDIFKDIKLRQTTSLQSRKKSALPSAIKKVVSTSEIQPAFQFLKRIHGETSLHHRRQIATVQALEQVPALIPMQLSA